MKGQRVKFRFLLAATKTGGHIFPAMAVARALDKRGHEVLLVTGTSDQEIAMTRDSGIRTAAVRARRLKGGGLPGTIIGIASLPLSVAKAMALVRSFEPHAALGFGGFTSGPVILGARLSGVPCAVCEQNSVPGLTNRLLSRIASKVMVAYRSAAEALGPGKTVLTGNPVRPEVLAAREARARREPGRNVLVLGGSQGSRFLNLHVPAAVAEAARMAGEGLAVVHQAGRGRVREAEQAYRGCGVEARVEEFIEDMAGAYAWADVAICRAGAGTVSEVAAVGLPAVFVPFAAAADDHQTANAAELVQAGAAFSVAERDFDPVYAGTLVASVLTDAKRASAMSRAALRWSVPDALDRVVEEALALVKA